jgi:hypothetical protein
MQVIEPAQIRQPCRLQGIGIMLAILAKVRNVPLQGTAAVVIFVYFLVKQQIGAPSGIAGHLCRVLRRRN